MVMIQPTLANPSVPTFNGPSSHSPLPIEIPSAIRLGPRTNYTTSLRPRGAPAQKARNVSPLGRLANP
jgi:hypothetical protein